MANRLRSVRLPPELEKRNRIRAAGRNRARRLNCSYYRRANLPCPTLTSIVLGMLVAVGAICEVRQRNFPYCLDCLPIRFIRQIRNWPLPLEIAEWPRGPNDIPILEKKRTSPFLLPRGGEGLGRGGPFLRALFGERNWTSALFERSRLRNRHGQAMRTLAVHSAGRLSPRNKIPRGTVSPGQFQDTLRNGMLSGVNARKAAAQAGGRCLSPGIKLGCLSPARNLCGARGAQYRQSYSLRMHRKRTGKNARRDRTPWRIASRSHARRHRFATFVVFMKHRAAYFSHPTRCPIIRRLAFGRAKNSTGWTVIYLKRNPRFSKRRAL